MCRNNGLEFFPVPESVRILNTIEQKLVSPVLQFNSIVENRPEHYKYMRGYKHIRGSVVNVPVSVADMYKEVNSVPRSLDETNSFVVVCIARRKQDFIDGKRPFAEGVVRAERLKEGLEFPTQQPLYKKLRIKLKSDAELEGIAEDFNSHSVVYVDENDDPEFPDDKYAPQETMFG